jgi:hypothetical protein
MPDLQKEDIMTPEQRYRLEMMKDKTPSTNLFVWVIPVFLLACWLGKTDSGRETVQWVQEYAVKEVPASVGESHPDFSRYPHGDPVCGGEFWCIDGWRL